MDENKVTIEMIEEKKRIWDEYKDHAEQHEFIKLIAPDMWIEAMYKNVKENWNQEHAEILMQLFEKTFRYVGIK